MDKSRLSLEITLPFFYKYSNSNFFFRPLWVYLTELSISNVIIAKCHYHFCCLLGTHSLLMKTNEFSAIKYFISSIYD